MQKIFMKVTLPSGSSPVLLSPISWGFWPVSVYLWYMFCLFKCHAWKLQPRSQGFSLRLAISMTMWSCIYIFLWNEKEHYGYFFVIVSVFSCFFRLRNDNCSWRVALVSDKETSRRSERQHKSNYLWLSSRRGICICYHSSICHSFSFSKMFRATSR